MNATPAAGKILVVEDDPLSRLMLVSTLQTLGFDVIECENGREAWLKFSTEQPRIVVSDWHVPDLDGLQLCNRIREEVNDYVYFILVTNSYLKDEAENIAIESGVDDFLPKPVKLDDLRNRLRVARRFLDHTARIQHLESILPICGYCKKIRNDKNYWQQIEAYIGQRTGTRFSHSVCPACYEQHVAPQLAALTVHPAPAVPHTCTSAGAAVHEPTSSDHDKELVEPGVARRL